jgi:hypothetical protein
VIGREGEPVLLHLITPLVLGLEAQLLSPPPNLVTNVDATAECAVLASAPSWQQSVKKS